MENETGTEIGHEAAVHVEPFYQSPTFWVAIAFLLLLFWFALALSIVLKPRSHDMPQELSRSAPSWHEGAAQVAAAQVAAALGHERA